MILIRALVSGSSIVFPESLKFEEIVSSIKKHSPTQISLVPTTLRRILIENISPDPGIKYLYLGGGPSGDQLAVDAAGKGWPVVKVYGSSETCSMVTALYPEEIKLRPASSGKILGANRIRITGNDAFNSGSGINESRAGEILVSAKSLFREYYGDPELTAKKIQNGWFHTGDYGMLDNEGYLFIDSRREDIIITGGETVSALEVESAIKNSPGVSDTYVFHLNDEIWGQVVCAAVVTESQDKVKLKSFLQTKLAGYKIPKQIFFLDALPRNEMGKINRTALLKKISPD
jgi:O-succinylbenzoic acid--CoA ligase